MSNTTYTLGHALIRQLLPLAEGREERAALQRLEDFRGTFEDVQTAAAMFGRAGEDEQARIVRELADG